MLIASCYKFYNRVFVKMSHGKYYLKINNPVKHFYCVQMEQLIVLGQIDASDTLSTALHAAAYSGSKKALKKVLNQGIS